MIYRARNYEGHSKDYDFSRTSMQEHWRAGYQDAIRTLRHPEVLSAPRIMRASSRSISFATAANRKGLANVSDPERAGSICIRSRFRLPAMPAVAGGYAGLTVLTLRACPRVVL
jgi:hypothetical protein